jgi:hypothetical protein
MDNVIFGFLPVLFSVNIINPFDLKNVSKLSLFEFKRLKKVIYTIKFLLKINGFIGYCDSSFGVLKSKLKKLDSFFSHTPVTLPLAAIQKVFTEMKTELTLIKEQFQRQISSGSVDLCTAWKSSLSLVNLYSQESINIC